MKKKLIFFAYDLRIGGIENALLNLFHFIDYKKYDVTLVLESRRGELLNFVNSNVKIVEYKLSNSKFVLWRKGYNFLKRFLWSINHKYKYDFSCCYATYSLMGSTLAKISSINSSLYIHSDYTNIYKEKEDFKKFFDRRKVECFHSLIFVSNESRHNFLQIYPSLKSKSYVLNNFVDNQKIIELSNESIEESPKKDKLLVFIGRLEESSKRISKLLQVMRYMKEKQIKIELWIIGDGPDRKEYEDYIKQNQLNDMIRLMGMKQNPYPYMKLANYIILTSDYEGFPVVYLEAICLKKKIITTMNLSDDQIMIPNNYGFIISKEVNKMCDEIIDILNYDNLIYSTLDMNQINNIKKIKLEQLIEKGEIL